MEYKEALALLIKRNENLDYVPEIIDIDFDGGGDYQIGDMTWDHENASITVKYREPGDADKRTGKRYEYHIDMEYYGYDDKQRKDSGFAALVNDLIAVAVEKKK